MQLLGTFFLKQVHAVGMLNLYSTVPVVILSSTVT